MATSRPPERPPAPPASGRRRASGILSDPIDASPTERLAATYPPVTATPGMTVTHRASGFTGVLVRIESGNVEIRGRTGAERVFAHRPGGFSVDGRPVSLVRAPSSPTTPTITASGSLAVANTSARVARAGRIWVEGIHDAALVERVWGDDLRIEGIVVERLDGIDDLEREVRRFAPNPARKLGVLVDHLVEGSKESRIAGRINDPFVLVTGTPFVDVWQAIRPGVAGLDRWPDIPRNQEWKAGICEVLGFGDVPTTWRTLLSRVNSYADLEPALVGAVERLIDFITEAT